MINDFDNIVKKKMDHHSADVPPDAWDNIQKKKKKRRFPFWIFLFLVLLGVTSSIIYQKNGSSEKEKFILSTANQNSSTGKMTLVDRASEATFQTSMVTDSSHKSAKRKNANDNKNDSTNTFSNNVSSKKNTIKSGSATSNHKTKKSKNEFDRGRGRISLVRAETADIFVHTTESLVDSTFNDKANETGEGSTISTNDRNFNPSIISLEDSSLQSNIMTGQLLNWPPVTKGKMPGEIISDGKKKRARKKWSIDLAIAPFIPFEKNEDVVSIKRTENTPLLMTEFQTDEISSKLQPSVSYTIGIKRSISQNMKLGTGIQYSRINEKVRLAGNETKTTFNIIQRLNNEPVPTLVSDTVSSVTNGYRVINALNSYEVISLPLSIEYNFLRKNKWNASLTGGIYFNIKNIYKNSIKGDLETNYNEAQNQKENTRSADIFAGIRIGRLFSGRYTLFAEPMFRLNLSDNSINNVLINRSIHRASIDIGISYFFK